MAATAPFLFVAANAVKEIQHGIPRVGRVAGRRIDERLAFVADGFGIVLDHLELAVGDAFARLVETVRRIRKGRFVVRAKRDRSTKSATTTLPALAGGDLSRVRFAFGDDVLLRECSNLARELELIAGNRARVGDANVIALKIQHLDKRNLVAGDFAFLQLGFALLIIYFRVGLPGQVGAVLLEGIGAFLEADLRIELGFPSAGDGGGEAEPRQGCEGQESDFSFHWS